MGLRSRESRQFIGSAHSETVARDFAATNRDRCHRLFCQRLTRRLVWIFKELLVPVFKERLCAEESPRTHSRRIFSIASDAMVTPYYLNQYVIGCIDTVFGQAWSSTGLSLGQIVRELGRR